MTNLPGLSDLKRKSRHDEEVEEDNKGWGEQEGQGKWNEGEGEEGKDESKDGGVNDDATGDDMPPAKKHQTSHMGYSGALTTLEYQGTIQVANNTLEGSTYSGGSRIHHIQLLLDDYRFLFFYFDASGMVKYQESWHFVTDFGKIAAALVALARCDVRRLGAFPHMNPPVETPYPGAFPPPDLEGFTLEFDNGKDERPVKLTLGKHIFSQYISIGRKTFVYDVAPPAAGKNMVLKVSQQARTRTAEWELIETTRAKGVEHIPEIHAYSQLHDLRHDAGPRKDLHEIFGALDREPNYEDRVVRAMVSTTYMPLAVRLAEFPEDVMIMAEQMVNCTCAFAMSHYFSH